MDRDSEIAKINHELDILRSRYALYDRWGRVLRLFLVIVSGLVVILAAIGIFKLSLDDPLMGIVIGVLFLVVVALIWWGGPYLGNWPRRDGWIDLASRPPMTPIFRRSDAEIIEEQIADRERRLRELETAL